MEHLVFYLPLNLALDPSTPVSCYYFSLLLTDLARTIDKKLQTDVGILNFSKAFDKVSHTKLLHKLECYGITGNILYWIKSFLYKHTQQVAIDGSYSSPCLVTLGVLQGSVLGPVLFLIYINDISHNIHSQLQLFANDCLMYRTIQSSDNHDTLQDDLNTLTSWAKALNMELTSINVK